MDTTSTGQVRASFRSFHPQIPGWSLCLSHSASVLLATTLSEVVPLLHSAWNASLAGKWVALCLSYEAAPAMDPALRSQKGGEFPLAWAAIFDASDPNDDQPGVRPYTVGAWTPLVERGEYEGCIRRIHELIRQGETYQVNYTVPFRATFSGCARTWFHELALAQGAPYSAYLDMGRFRVLSLSPELFFRLNGQAIESHPMKGTWPRGRWPDEDDAHSRLLAGCPKNRAENVMITDLVRSDLGRIATPGTVEADPLFEVQRFRTVLQMVSTVRARIRPGTTLADVFKALFPGGSVTGAPKVRTMEIIRGLEPHHRGVYTGALGFLRPGGEGVFNLPIRTVLVDTLTGEAEFRVGGGITAGSTARGEFEECRTKMAFLTSPRIGFSLLESLLLRDGHYVLLDRHLDRMASSAGHFLLPFRKELMFRVLEELRIRLGKGAYKVRLLLDEDGTPGVESFPLGDPTPNRPLRIGLASTQVSSEDVFLFHKTTNRSVYEERLGERPDCDDVILWNERGELTETTRANLVLTMAGERFTPPVHSGLLAGTLRRELLETGTIRERVLFKEDLARAEAVHLINSVRGWMETEFLSGNGNHNGPARRRVR